MKNILLLLLMAVPLLITVPAPAQSLNKASVQRIGDYGKLWNILCFFHPEMAYGKVDADSLFTAHIEPLLKAPSAEHFKEAVQAMLAALNDPATFISGNAIEQDSFTLHERPLLRWLPGHVALFYFTPQFMEDAVMKKADTAFRRVLDSMRSANGIIIDLRSNYAVLSPRDIHLGQGFMELLTTNLIRQPLLYAGERTRIHYGHEDDLRNVRFYSQGWQFQQTHSILPSKDPINNRVSLLINRHSRYVANQVIALQKAHIATVVADGDLVHFEPVATYDLPLADGLTVTIRVAEPVYPDGSKTFIPDKMIDRQYPHDENIIINTAVEGLKNERPISNAHNAAQQLFTSGPVKGYDSFACPPPALRLMGLCRYWGIINYFCPNKDLITKNWDSVLYAFVPQFLNAKDSVAYNFTVASLIRQINDSHGFFQSRTFKKLYESTPEIQLKYLEGKTIVYRIYNDSLKKLLAIGDELTDVQGMPVNIMRDSLARYISASNPASLQRNVTELLLSGSKGTSVTIQYKHAGKSKTLTLDRKMKAYDLFTPKEGPVLKKITADIGYADMGRVEVSGLDSLFSQNRRCSTLILDYRSYPKNSIWSMLNYLTDQRIASAVGITMIADSPDPATTTRQESLWQIPVQPNDSLYKGQLILLVNEITQSQAEYSCMVLQATGKKVTVIGSQTAGADGDITYIKIPGGILTAFSGHGIHYPDGRPTQGIGIVPNIVARPTIEGIKHGKDEVLERAIVYAKTGK